MGVCIRVSRQRSTDALDQRGIAPTAEEEGYYAGDVPKFIPRLRERESDSRLALDLVILSAARSGQVRHAVFDEFDLEAKLWTIPP
ncbi:hypothetical protein F7D01_02665 [Erythrobacter sp. 3-20A1M]|uniref:hypothetical protein n=1 Tax=Erythrobacter sp. 3-20A1M TaxID=2653850 RepID=UPI001BFC5A91|nr:hypothetical protein [Erythrobacter sp. 3-20A1M]QWC56140.1 hypothetical protein F7D01_02665 [Erythrobacter sp. 3-20A1M]